MYIEITTPEDMSSYSEEIVKKAIDIIESEIRSSSKDKIYYNFVIPHELTITECTWEAESIAIPKTR